MFRSLQVLSALASLASGAPAQQLQTSPHLTFPPGNFAQAFYHWTAIDVGDLDGDGDLDLVVAHTWMGRVRLFTNNGLAVFTEVTSTHLPPMTPSATFVATAVLFDADGDGDLDLFAGAQPGDHLLQNDGSGHFTDVTSTHLPATSTNSWRMSVGDLDGDGAPDLVTWNAASTPRLSCLRNGGQGVFAANSEPLLTVAQSTYGVGIADLDGDQRADVLTDGGRRLLFGSPNGLVDVTATHMPPHAAGTFHLADIDADADIDVVGAQYLLVNDGTGNFADATATRHQPAGTDRALLATGDFDGDRDLDVVAIAWWFLAPHPFQPSPPRLLSNLHRHIQTSNSPQRGQPLQVGLFAAPGYGAVPTAALPFLAARPGTLPVPGLGCIGLDLQTTTPLPILVVLPSPNGQASFALPIPSWPQLANVTFHLQALTLDANLDLRLTNCIAPVIR